MACHRPCVRDGLTAHVKEFFGNGIRYRPEVEKIERVPVEKVLRAKLKEWAIVCSGLASVITYLPGLINVAYVSYTGRFSPERG